MITLTDAQKALLEGKDQIVRALIEIDITSPLRYCTGPDPISHGLTPDWYEPRAMRYNPVALTTPKASQTSVLLDDLDGTIRTAWYSERFSGFDVNVYLYMREFDGDWTLVQSITWVCKKCRYVPKTGWFTVELHAAAGTRPRYGLAVGSRSIFPYAPEPGESLKIGQSGGITWRTGVGDPPPLPGGQQRAYEPRVRTYRDGAGADTWDGGGGGGTQHPGGGGSGRTGSTGS